MYAHADNGFQKVRELLRPVHFEIAARGKHVGNIEREVRTLKKRCRCTMVFVPYKRMPRIMIKENLEDKFHLHNIFTPEYYTLQAIRPA